MATILPPRIPMSPEYQGEPVPSMMWPLVMIRSNLWAKQTDVRSRNRAMVLFMVPLLELWKFLLSLKMTERFWFRVVRGAVRT